MSVQATGNREQATGFLIDEKHRQIDCFLYFTLLFVYRCKMSVIGMIEPKREEPLILELTILTLAR
jgi:hypothetical protein